MVYELVDKKIRLREFVTVLILVFVEDGLWGLHCQMATKSMFVLILVFVEDGLWEEIPTALRLRYAGLNPCFCGRWFMSPKRPAFKIRRAVLILVFVEDGLWVKVKEFVSLEVTNVLILVFVEDGLWEEIL